MSKKSIDKLRDAMKTAFDALEQYERDAERRRIGLLEAENKAAICRKALADYQRDIAAIEYADRLDRLYGKDPRQ